jgi:uncharacterized protein
MTKIMAIGDIHGDKGLVKKLAKKAKDENVDLVIIPGDITWLEESTEDLIGPFVKQGKEVLLLPGNHETMPTIDFLSAMYPKTKNLHGKGIKKNGVGIFGAGYATNAGPFCIEEKELAKKLNEAHEKIKDAKKKIMVTHMHHQGSKAEFVGFPGSKAIKDAIEKFKPDILINGHIHEARGLQEKIGKTKIINVARKPAIFEI